MPFTDEDKWKCAQRELKQRQRVYPRLVAAGKMTQAQADREIGLMDAIAKDYELKAKPSDLWGTP